MDIISKKNSILLFLPLIFFVLGIFFFIYAASEQVQNEYNRFWEVRAIDTMKNSRDKAREKLNDGSYDKEIEKQVQEIARAGTTHVTLGTPYDEEFIPFLKRWVLAARKNNLKVWYRGNLSGWEGWFDYPDIDRQTHTDNIKSFILDNPTLFEDGDIFTSCPECENGGPGDPRKNGDVNGHREFLINEYGVVKQAFQDIGKKVTGNYYSMNGDVAKLIMDRETTKKLDGVITVDHYVATPQQLAKDINMYASSSGGKVVLGEWGAPIPDIHGEMSEDEQSAWIEEALRLLITNTNLIGLNYWVNEGGSTALWHERKPQKAVTAITKFMKPNIVKGTIKDEAGRNINGVSVTSSLRSFTAAGSYTLPLIKNDILTFYKQGYKDVILAPTGDGTETTRNIVMVKNNKNYWDKILEYLYKFFLS